MRASTQRQFESAIGFRAGADDLHANEDLCAEAQRLLVGPARQLRTADALWEAGVVLDPGAGAGLAAGGHAFKNQRPRPLRGGVDGSGEPDRAGSDDDDVVQLMFGACAQSRAACQLADPMSGSQVHLGTLRRRSRGPCHPDKPFVDSRSLLWLPLDLCRSRIDEVLWRRQLGAVREHGDRPLGAELDSLGQ